MTTSLTPAGRVMLSGCIHGAFTPCPAQKAMGLSLSAVQRLASLTRKIAIGDSLSAVQHLASLTRKSRPSVASNYQAVYMGLRPIPRPRGLFVKSPLGNPEKQRLTFIVWFFTGCSQGIKRPAYMPPIRLRRREALDQRIARLTHKSQPSVASNYQAGF